MTDEMIALRALLEKSSDADLLREMIGFTAHRLMELEVGGLTGAGHGERSADRLNWRNGYRDRDPLTAGVRTSYKLNYVFTPFVNGSFDGRNYRLSRDDNGFDRDSTGYKLTAGTQFRVAGVIDGEVYGRPFVTFNSDLRGAPDGQREDVPWASLDSEVNDSGWMLAPGYAFDVPAGGYVAMGFSVATYPGLQALATRVLRSFQASSAPPLAGSPWASQPAARTRGFPSRTT